MGEMVITVDPQEELVAHGLGSCIGLAMLDRQSAVAGLAHVVLPERGDGHGAAARYADLAVPELLDRMLRAGARRSRIQVAIAGGASMFRTTSQLDIGARNQDAVHQALEAARLPCDAAAVGGDRGRTLRVRLTGPGVTSTSAGETATELLPGIRARRGRRDPERNAA